MLSKDMQIKLLRTKVERLNHRIEELMAIAANKTRTVKRQKNEIEALRIDLARHSTGSMPHDDLVDEIDRLNHAIAAYKVGKEPDPDLLKTRQHKKKTSTRKLLGVSSKKKSTETTKWACKELNPQSLEGGNTWGMILDFCSFKDLGCMATTCTQFSKHVDSENLSETWQDIAIALVEQTFGAESVEDVILIKEFEKDTTWKSLCPRIRRCMFLGLPAEDGGEDDEADVYVASTIIVDVGMCVCVCVYPQSISNSTQLTKHTYNRYHRNTYRCRYSRLCFSVVCVL